MCSRGRVRTVEPVHPTARKRRIMPSDPTPSLSDPAPRPARGRMRTAVTVAVTLGLTGLAMPGAVGVTAGRRSGAPVATAGTLAPATTTTSSSIPARRRTGTKVRPKTATTPPSTRRQNVTASTLQSPGGGAATTRPGRRPPASTPTQQLGTIDFDGMTAAQAADRISPHVVIAAELLKGANGVPTDEVLTFVEQGSDAQYAYVMSSEKVTGAASYGGYRILTKTRIDATTYAKGRGAKVPLGGNSTDAFFTVTFTMWHNSATATANKNASRNTVAPRAQRLVKTGSMIVTTKYPASGEQALIHTRSQTYDPAGKPIGPEWSAYPMVGAPAPFIDPGAAQQQCQSEALVVGDFVVSGGLIVAGEVGLVAGAFAAGLSFSAVGAPVAGVLAGSALMQAGLIVAGSTVLAVGAGAAYYTLCMLNVTPPPGGPVPPFTPPDGSPTATPTVECEQTAQVPAGGSGSSSGAAQVRSASEASGDEVAETVIVDGSTTKTVCVLERYVWT